MTTQTLDRIATLLGKIGAAGAFAARRTAKADDLDLEIKGLGRLRFPISASQAKELCKIARPARYGRGEQTLLDREVRDTWQIPKSRVKIDKRRWNKTLLPILDKLRADLGLPAGCRLKADLHSMLVYAPGQFFLPHQDSEKSEEMIATLVVTLPAAFKGGAMHIEHRGEKVTYRASKRPLSFVAFYADCHHEVRPVKEGYRIVLTYNLELEGGDEPSRFTPATAPATVDAVAKGLREHFETPLAPRWASAKVTAAPQPPDRLVYLLDHQYTERGLAWSRLKGDDAARARVLLAAADRADCEVVLALAEVQETWSCDDEDWFGSRYRRRYWEDDDDEYDEPSTQGSADSDGYELIDLIDSMITIERSLEPSGKEAEAFVTSVDDSEVCATTPSKNLQPYATEHEGYMGNYGNTMDRWYRRAAIVVWPRERTFAIRTEASPAWGLQELNLKIRAGATDEARKLTTSMLPFWEVVAGREERAAVFAKALLVANGLDAPKLATSLLEPFHLAALTPARARALVALVERYGERWLRDLLSSWSGPQRWREVEPPKVLDWLSSLPGLIEALVAADDGVGTVAARCVLQDRWKWLKQVIEEWRGYAPRGLRDQQLAALATPLLGFLESTAIAGAGELRDEVLTFLRREENDPLISCLVSLLRRADKKLAPAVYDTLELESLRQHCTQVLTARLARPAREGGNWSMSPPTGCDCGLCVKLAAFLEDPESQSLEWPLAKKGRMHIHRWIDAHELPVRHKTRRQGSPYTLVLTKTKALFEAEARERRAWQSDLTSLTTRRAKPGSPRRAPTKGRGKKS